MLVKIDILQKKLNRILDELAKEFGNEIKLDNNQYWAIRTEEKYNSYKSPEKLILGDLEDDYKFTIEMNDPDFPLFSIDLEKIAILLQAIADEKDFHLNNK
jgi:hypothetical protein